MQVVVIPSQQSKLLLDQIYSGEYYTNVISFNHLHSPNVDNELM